MHCPMNVKLIEEINISGSQHSRDVTQNQRGNCTCNYVSMIVTVDVRTCQGSRTDSNMTLQKKKNFKYENER